MNVLNGNVRDYLPSIWAAAQTFAFSGLDGETDWFHPFLGQTLADGPGILFHLGRDDSGGFELRLCGWKDGAPVRSDVPDLRPSVIGPDILDVTIALPGDAEVGFRLVWRDRRTVLGRATGRGMMPCICATKRVNDDLPEPEEAFLVTRQGVGRIGGREVLPLGEDGGEFAITCRSEGEGDLRRLLGEDFDSLFAGRVSFYDSLPLPVTDDEEVLRTFVKACAVMKVNTETACGEITNRWTTPDRWPHRHMWLWDSAFHSLGAQHLDPELGQDCIRAVLTKQRKDGFIPHTMAPDPEEDSKMTQPPILAWAVWELYQKNPNPRFLAEVYAGLEAYLRWDLSNMDTLGTGLLQWQFRGPDSGMDNSPRFDEGADFDAVDLNSFAANECQSLAKIARELGRTEEADRWKQEYFTLVQRINNRLWNDEDGFYYDRRKDGSWVGVKTVDGFLPLFSAATNSRRAAILVADHLTNEKEFWPHFPVPSVALSEPKFELDMWRGPTWINYNYMISLGLRRSGYLELAAELTNRTIQEISRWRAERSSIYEFYDPFGKTAPQDLSRKGHVRRWPGDGIPVISDFFWSSALFADMVATKYGISKR